MHSILGWASFCMNHGINAAWHGGNQPVALLRCNEARVALIAAFRSSALLGLVSLIFLLTVPNRLFLGFGWGEFAGQSSTVTPWSLNQLLVLWQSGHLKCLGRWLRWLWTSENTVEQHQQMTWQPKSSLTVETSHWTSRNLDSLPLHSSSRLWDLDCQIKCKIYFHQEFWPLSNSPVLFLLSPGKMLLTMFLFQKWLGSSFPEDVWAWWLLMHWLQLQFTPCEALPSLWIGFAWQYSQECGHPCCLCKFSYPISSSQISI